MKDRMKIVEREYSSSKDDDLEQLIVDVREKDKWDCESILSTYSNIYNHPKLIPDPPKVNYFIIYIMLKLFYYVYIMLITHIYFTKIYIII